MRISDPGRPGLWAVGMLAAGGLHTASFAPLNAWPLQILALAALAGATRGESPRTAAWRGLWFGLGWMGSGLWWLYISLHDFGGLPPALSALAVALLAAFLALYPAGALAMGAWLGRHRPAGSIPLFAACWLASELARGQWLSGFPWLASGYAHTDGPLAALAPWLGVYGVGAIAAAIAATLAAFVGRVAGAEPRARWAWAVGLSALIGGAQWGPRDFTTSAGSIDVALLQTNIPQDLKFDLQRLTNDLANLREQLQNTQATLVVTPESTVPIPRTLMAPTEWQALTDAVRLAPPGRGALIGIFVGDDAAGYTNALVGVRSGGPPRDDELAADYVYGKRHLLPFGEYVPPGFHWFVNLLQIPLGDQTPGTHTATFDVAGQRVRPLICYEDLFGEEVAASLVGPQAATVLVNATNLAWFGRHLVQDQHLQFSRMRSLEFQRPFARATNTGATALIDHHGRVTARLPPLEAARLEGRVEGREGSTPYTRWVSAMGLWPAWGLVLLGVSMACWRREGKTPRSRPEAGGGATRSEEP